MTQRITTSLSPWEPRAPWAQRFAKLARLCALTRTIPNSIIHWLIGWKSEVIETKRWGNTVTPIPSAPRILNSSGPLRGWRESPRHTAPRECQNQVRVHEAGASLLAAPVLHQGRIYNSDAHTSPSRLEVF